MAGPGPAESRGARRHGGADAAVDHRHDRTPMSETTTPPAATHDPRRPLRRRLLRIAVWLAVAVTAIALLGFFVAPIVVKQQLETRLSQALHRQVSVERVRINPFALSASVLGFVMREGESDAPLLAFDELFVDASIASVYRLSPVLDRVRLVRPQARLVRLADGRYNVQDLIDAVAGAPPTDEPARFSLNNIEITEGRIDFDDRPEGTTHEVTGLSVGIPFLSNLPYAVDIDVQPSLSARINGSPLQLKGETKPFKDSLETTLALDFDRIDLPRYAGYSPVPLPVRLRSGELDTRLTLRFVAGPAREPQTLTLAGSAELRRLEVDDPAGEPLAGVQRVRAELEQFDVIANALSLGSLAVEQPLLHVTRRRDGSTNLDSLRTPPGVATAARSASPPLRYRVARLTVSDGRVLLADRQPAERPFETDIRRLDIEAADLANAPEARARLRAGYETTTGATFAYDGEVRLEPVAADGTITVRAFRLADLFPYYERVLDLRVDDGAIDLDARVALASIEPVDLRVTDIGATIRSLKLAVAGEKSPQWTLASAEVRGGTVDLAKRRISLGEVSARDGAGSLHRAKDGTLNVSRLIKTTAQTGRADTPADGAGWVAEAELVRLSRFRVAYEDQAWPTPFRTVLAPIDGTYRNFSNARGARGRIDVRATIDGKGRATVAGDITTNPVAGSVRIDVRGVELAPLQPMIDERVNVTITGGALQASGRVDFDLDRPTPAGRFDGDLEITDFASIDKPQQAGLLQWKSLRLGRVRAASEPMQLTVGNVALSDFYSRLILNADGTLNVQNLLTTGDPANDGQARADGTRATQAAQDGAARPLPGVPVTGSGKPPPDIRIGRIALAGGNVSFSDFFIKPNYSANLTGVAGSVGSLAANSAGEVDLLARVDNTAPVTISGRINPLGESLFLDLRASARDVDLPPLTPYSAKYAGYGIEKGKLSMEVKYRIEGRKLEAENRVVLDQLTFGDKVDSPEATKLPVLLAVALLKDRNGVIDVNLPISGSIDDPEFSLGGIIVRVIVNLIVKVVTAPFAIIGALGGGGEELAYIEFAPGSADVTQASEAKLGSIARALAERPALKLDVSGRIDPGTDRDGLRKASIGRQVRAQKAKALGKAVDDEEIIVTAEEYPKYLAAAYRAADFPRPRNVIGLLKDLPVPEMEALMLTHAGATDDDLRRLANDRAQRVKNWLVDRGQIPAERVFLTAPRLSADGIKDKGSASRVDFSLR
jgi:hypothetical protein